MCIKNDNWIRFHSNIIEPFNSKQVNTLFGVKAISYGLSSYGYDVRLGNKFKVFTNVWNGIIDPKDFDHNNFVDFKGDVCVIPPNSFVLAETFESLRIPRNVLGICMGKSTYARCGLIVNITPLEPEWEGKITVEISNTTPLPAKIYAWEGIAQILFMGSEEDCEISYADRKGKYQKSLGIEVSRV